MTELTKDDIAVFETTLKTGDLNIFTSYYFRLEFSGTRYTPEDLVEEYAILHEAWLKAGKPDKELSARAEGELIRFKILWEDYKEPVFLLHHGFMLLPWVNRMVRSGKPITVVEGGTGCGKCLSAGTLIDCCDGIRCPIEEIQEGRQIWGLDYQYRLIPQQVTGLYHDNTRPLLQIATALGKKLQCTPNHPLLTVNGWVLASRLAIGNHVALPRIVPGGQSDQTLATQELILLGLLLGDGSVSGKNGTSVRFTNTNPELQDLFRDAVRQLNDQFVVTVCTSGGTRAPSFSVTDPESRRRNRFRVWCKTQGILGCTAHTKYVPQEVFVQPDKALALFLACLYACDGWAYWQAEHQPQIGYGTVSRVLANDVQALLLRFGIVSRIRERDQRRGEKVFHTYEILITNKWHVRTFLERIGIIAKDTTDIYENVRHASLPSSGSADIIPKRDIREYIKARARERGTPICKRLPGNIRPNEKYRMRRNPSRGMLLEYAEWLEDDWLHDLATSDVYWDRITSIEEMPAAPTYNLEVSPDHNFITNGIITHNTANIGIIELARCALIPGYDFLNVAPTLTQAEDMLGEVSKWVEGTPFEKFVVRPRSGELFKQRPYPMLTIKVGKHKSTFGCMTIGKHGNWILGKGKDTIHVDEAGLVDGVGEAIPRLVTRLRGSRRDGRPRAGRMGFSSNPHINPSFSRLVKKAEKLADDPDSKYFFARPPSTANTAITRRQLDLQLEMLEPADRARWLEGDRSVIEMSGQLSVFPDLCHEPALDAIMETFVLDGTMPPLSAFEERDGMGVIHWALPPESMHLYLVAGDPGQANANKMSNNNVPVVLVFDITNFPDSPATLRAFHWIDGKGKYGPWKNYMRESMLLYPGLCCYDGTGTQVAFAEDDYFAGMQLWPVGLGGGGSGGVKALAKTFFKLMAGDGLFAWPYIEGLWHQCAIYREGGAGVKHLADDIVSTLFVATYYLRATYISVLGSKYLLADELAAETVGEGASIGSDTRYRRSTGRYGRGKCTNGEM